MILTRLETLFLFNMNSEFMENKMLKFLELNYPVSRVKTKMRFRRGITLDDGENYLLGVDTQFITLQIKLMEKLFKIFNLDENTNRRVIKKFLHLK